MRNITIQGFSEMELNALRSLDGPYLDGTWLEFITRCLAHTQTPVRASKFIDRVARAKNLLTTLEHVVDLPGVYVEAGVLRGFSARLILESLRSRSPDFLGAGVYLIDSFEGLSSPSIEDFDGQTISDAQAANVRKGAMAISLDVVKENLIDFPAVSMIKGFIPECLVSLELGPIRMLHIDVDLYEPTLALLEKFWSRVVPGGFVVNDDYGSEIFRGSSKSWDKFFKHQTDALCSVSAAGQSLAMKLS